MAIALAEAGGNVAGYCHFAGNAEETCAQIERIGRETFSVSGDMSDKEAQRRLVDETIKKFGA